MVIENSVIENQYHIKRNLNLVATPTSKVQTHL